MANIIPPRQLYGMQFDGPSSSGGHMPPMVDIMGNGSGDFVSDLSQYKSQGCRAIIKFVGSPPNYQASNLSFVMGLWKDQMDKAAAKTNPQQMGNFVQDRTLVGNWLMDDSGPGSQVYGGKPPTMDDHDEMARYSKSIWSQVPTTVRLHNTILATKSDWAYLDYGWMQWHKKQGPALAWFVNNINAGRSVGLGSILGFNLLNGGSGITAPWNFSPNHQANAFGMSPQELDAVGAAFSNCTYAIGIMGWAAQPNFDKDDYYNRPEIQSAILRIANRAIGHAMGPLNWRGATIPDPTPVVGNWGVISVGHAQRYANAPTSISLPALDTDPTGGLDCILCYSRDSARSFEVPLGWSQAQRIAGTAAQGGELSMLYRIAADNNPITVNLLGPGITGNAIMGRRFAFSNATTNALHLAGAVGSARSWASKTGMGPIPGVTSTLDDAIVMICGARANDFGGGSVDEDMLSATTSGGETWNRLFACGSSVNDDQGMFVDWTATTGIASIATKSWTLTAGTEAGVGCGFMVSFAPFAIVTGTPPVMLTSFDDVALSVGSTLGFTIQSTGDAPITYSKDSGPSNVTLDGSTGAFQFTPTTEGDYVIVLAAVNSFGTDTGSFVVAASSPGGSGSSSTGANSAPVITHPGNKTVAAHDLLSFVVVATDADGDVLSYALDSGAPLGTFLDSRTGQFVWIPAGDQGPGVYPIVAVVSDGIAESRSTFTVTVNDTPWTRIGGPTAAFGRGGDVGNQFRRI